jgi:hypothetical protein
MRRAVMTTVAAAALAGVALAPAASAAPIDDLNAIAADYSNDGDITACAFTKAQLTAVRDQFGPDIEAYSPDLGDEVDAEIERWTSGGCSTGGGGPGGGGSSGGSNGGSQNGGGSTGQQAAYRASIKSLKVAKNRRSVKVKVRCPATAISGCHVILSGRLAGKSAAKHKSADIARGATKSITVKLKPAARTRLKTKGGKLKISAKTVGSTLAAASRSITIAP